MKEHIQRAGERLHRVLDKKARFFSNPALLTLDSLGWKHRTRQRFFWRAVVPTFDHQHRTLKLRRFVRAKYRQP
jgi:hypothetical protein